MANTTSGTANPLDNLTTDDLARSLHVAPETVRLWRHQGKGPRYFKAGRRVLYVRSDVERWIAEQQIKAAETRHRNAARNLGRG